MGGGGGISDVVFIEFADVGQTNGIVYGFRRFQADVGRGGVTLDISG